MSDADAAVDLFMKGCACSQSILGIYGPRYGLDQDAAMRLAAGFAAGMRLSETCGAVTGAFMVFGLAHCDASCRTIDGRKPAYEAITKFAERFRQSNTTLMCRDLLGCDINTPEGHKTAVDKNLFGTTCAGLVRQAAELIEELLPPSVPSAR